MRRLLGGAYLWVALFCLVGWPRSRAAWGCARLAIRRTLGAAVA